MTTSPEGAQEQGKIPAEKLVDLDKRLEQLEAMSQVGVYDEIRATRQAIDFVLHEQATGDDSPHKYNAVLSCLDDLNRALGEIKKLPDRVEL